MQIQYNVFDGEPYLSDRVGNFGVYVFPTLNAH